MRTKASYGISLPTKIVEKIDYLRADVARSKYFLRILEAAIENKSPQPPQVPARKAAAFEIVPAPLAKEKAQP